MIIWEQDLYPDGSLAYVFDSFPFVKNSFGSPGFQWSSSNTRGSILNITIKLNFFDDKQYYPHPKEIVTGFAIEYEDGTSEDLGAEKFSHSYKYEIPRGQIIQGVITEVVCEPGTCIIDGSDGISAIGKIHALKNMTISL